MITKVIIIVLLILGAGAYGRRTYVLAHPPSPQEYRYANDRPDLPYTYDQKYGYCKTYLK
jgi:hypothetical protein